MGICYSCLGLRRRDSHDAESTRLLDDDLYQSGYGYGALNQARQNQPDPEDLKREREALEAICQRTSDSVIDIWALQPQPHLQPRATLRSPISNSSLRVASTENAAAGTATAEHAETTLRQQPNGVIGTTVAPQQQKLTTVPKKEWGEVVISGKRSRKGRPGLNTDQENGYDVFGVLKVK
ncbi:late endosomal/lysosomal adaptor and MAPK and MTOR activator-domain-containing protein [Thermoascus aurantiacus ATCC 26904]